MKRKENNRLPERKLLLHSKRPPLKELLPMPINNLKNSINFALLILKQGFLKKKNCFH